MGNVTDVAKRCGHDEIDDLRVQDFTHELVPEQKASRQCR